MQSGHCYDDNENSHKVHVMRRCRGKSLWLKKTRNGAIFCQFCNGMWRLCNKRSKLFFKGFPLNIMGFLVGFYWQDITICSNPGRWSIVKQRMTTHYGPLDQRKGNCQIPQFIVTFDLHMIRTNRSRFLGTNAFTVIENTQIKDIRCTYDWQTISLLSPHGIINLKRRSLSILP